MQMQFFPSRRLTIYLAKLFFTRILAVLVMLVLVLVALDLLGSSGDILAQPGNGQAELLTYAGLRIPQLTARFLPYAVLLATIISLIGLNQNSEVIAMKAAGMSAHQVLAPLMLTAGAIALVSFAFNERIVTRSTATLKAWEANDYGEIPPDSDIRANVYLTDGKNILSAASISGRGADTQMTNVTFYQRGESGMIETQARAASATYAGPGWLLTDTTLFNVQTAETSSASELVVGEGLTLERVDLGKGRCRYGKLLAAIELD